MSPIEVDFLTLFPGMIQGYVKESILGRAVESGKVKVGVHNIRDWAKDKHRVTDDVPFGGGAGMLLKCEPLFAAIGQLKRPGTKVIYLAPDGELLTSAMARELANEEHLILLSGHYEGVDHRVRENLVDREVSIGDYVLTNGTLAGMVLLDAISRYIPGVLGDENSLTQDSFNNNLLSFPQYTRPADFQGMKVPEVLLSGNHAAIAAWRQAQRVERTRKLRPDLLSKENTKS